MIIHPAAQLFPLIDGDAFDRLVADIKANGQREPIVVLQTGEILNGRNRWRACEQLGVEPITRIYEGADPLGFVISLNLHRRHLNESQRAMMASKIANLPRGTNQHSSIELPTQSQAASMLNVSVAGIKRAANLLATIARCDSLRCRRELNYERLEGFLGQALRRRPFRSRCFTRFCPAFCRRRVHFFRIDGIGKLKRRVLLRLR